MSNWLRHGLICVVVSVPAICGCGSTSNGPKVVEVTGRVIYDGRPVEGANVIFHPVESDRTLASQSLTDEEGRFEMNTYVSSGEFTPGIAPGNYAVAVTKLDTGAVSTTLAPPKDLLPKKYGSPQTSGLTAEVAEGRENDFEFALVSN